jgi:Glycosyltransferases involved in cell wall biogenesis
VIPIKNEEENISLLVKSIPSAIDPLMINYEVIFVDDGSTDHSLYILKAELKEFSHPYKIIVFRRNYGQTAAISAGINYSSGKTLILLDADLQNDPADIPLLLQKMDEGFDVVSGWRKDRKDNFISRTLPSRTANSLISWVSGVKLHDYGCTLKAYRREYFDAINLYGEMHRFIPIYAAAAGAKVTEVIVQHHQRQFGKSKYGIDRTFKVVLDLLTVKFLVSYSAKPMRLFGSIGLFLMILSSIDLFFLIIRRIFFQTSVLASPFFQMGIMVFILGSQSLLMGLIAELLMRTYYESQGKPIYSIRSIHESDKE